MKNKLSFISIFTLCIALSLTACGGKVQENLDLFVAHFQVLSHSNSWFAHGATVPMLGGISRDSLSSEWNLYNILYTFMPVFWTAEEALLQINEKHYAQPFESNDRELFKIGVNFTNLHGALTDCPGREQNEWTGAYLSPAGTVNQISK